MSRAEPGPEEARRKRAFAIALAAAVALAIACFSLFSPGPKERFGNEDKLRHLLAYILLGGTTAHALRRQGIARTRSGWLAFLGAIAYGGLIEIVQPSFGRTGDLGDEAANALGAALGASTYVLGGAAAALAAAVLFLPAGAAGCAAAAGAPSGPPPTASERLLEQGRLCRTSEADLVRRFYEVLQAHVPVADRPLYSWLRARLEPDRGARRAALEAAARADPKLSGPLLDLGDLEFEEGRGEEAGRRWRAALEIEPRSARALSRLAWLERGSERGSERERAAAFGAVAAYLAAGPRVPDGFVAGAYRTLGERARAEAVLAETRAAGLDDAIASMMGGLLRLDAADPEGASRAFERALLRAPATLVEQDLYVRATLPRAVRFAASGAAVEVEELALLAEEHYPPLGLFRRGRFAGLLRLCLTAAGRSHEAEAILRCGS